MSLEVRERLKSQVATFRVPELQELLQFLNRRTSGNKRDLLQRAHDVIDRDPSMSLQTKIRIIFE